jgi:hypothetical protein
MAAASLPAKIRPRRSSHDISSIKHARCIAFSIARKDGHYVLSSPHGARERQRATACPSDIPLALPACRRTKAAGVRRTSKRHRGLLRSGFVARAGALLTCLWHPPNPLYFLAFFSLALRLANLPTISSRALFFNFFHCLHSSFVRMQAMHRSVFSSNLQTPMQGESTAM